MRLPSQETLKRICKSIAALDAIIMQDRGLRYYSYNASWSPPHEMASMRTGSGDHYFMLFAPNGTAIKGFCHEMGTHAHCYEGLPKFFEQPFLHEPAFTPSEVSFAIWSEAQRGDWQVNPKDALETGRCGEVLLGVVVGGPEKYHAWATSYYEREFLTSAVRSIFEHCPLNVAILANLNSSAEKSQIVSDLAEIGYPCALDVKLK